MKIIIIGAGEVGYNIAKYLSGEKHEVTIIEEDAQIRQRCADHLDVLTVAGNGASPRALAEAEIGNADMVIAVTDSDEVNMIACLIAKQYGSAKTVARIRNPEYVNGEPIVKGGVLGIDYIINPESAAAMEIAKLLHTPGAIALAKFGAGKVQMVEFRVEGDLNILNKPLRSLNLREKCLIAAILRQDKMIIPDGDDVIQQGDRIFVIGKSERMGKIEKLFGTIHRKGVRRVALLGAGRITYYLTKALLRDGIQVTIMEEDKDLCKEMAEKLPGALVICGDGTDIDLLKEEGIIFSDAFAALTTDDKQNILVSLLLKHFGVERVITRVSRPDYSPLLEKIGLDVPISPRLLTASTILQLLRRGDITSVALVEEGEAEIIEISAKNIPHIEGVLLRDLNFPREAIVGAIVHQSEVIVPGGNDIIREGDRVIIFTLPEALPQIAHLFRLS